MGERPWWYGRFEADRVWEVALVGDETMERAVQFAAFSWCYRVQILEGNAPNACEVAAAIRARAPEDYRVRLGVDRMPDPPHRSVVGEVVLGAAWGACYGMGLLGLLVAAVWVIDTIGGWFS